MASPQKVPNSMVAGPIQASVNPVDMTASRALTAVDFQFDLVRINSAGVVAVTVPTIATMGMPASVGQIRALVFEVVGAGIPTFAGVTGATTINTTAGPATVLPLGGAPVRNGLYVLVQQDVGGNAWTLQ